MLGCWLGLALLAACGDSSGPAVSAVVAEPGAAQPSIPAHDGERITLIMKTLTNPFFVEMERGARKAQHEISVDLQVKTATQETSIEQQIQLVNDAIEARSRAIVIAPGDSIRLVPVLKAAQDAGIHIVNLDNRLDPEAMTAAGMKPVPFISVDNEQGAYLAARFLADQVREPSQAIIIEGIRTADNAQQRRRGAERGLSTNARIRIVAKESANWKIDEAYKLAAKLFKQHPKVGLVFCANDMMAIGAIKYLQESGRTEVLVAGFDALGEVMPAIRAGQLAATVDQQAARQGYLGIKTALQMMAGQTPAMQVNVESMLVTAHSLK
jgi:ribose transport system substrate-binding protein